MDVGHAETVELTHALDLGAPFADRYEVLALLGAGGMGDVYRARDLELDEEIALKVLHRELAAAPGALERFRREVKLARRVTHPNVARTFDLGVHGDVRYLTMELILGESLSKRVGLGRKVPLVESLRIVAEVARGLAAAHAVGVVHRDLKPDNVMIERAAADERVVITDFGIARLAEADSSAPKITQAATTVGTPAYMSPEQVAAEELDGRSDIYALGVVLFEMLLGELPFRGDTPYSLAAARLSASPVDPRSKDPSIPEAVAELVLSALARRRDARPDAQAFLDRIEAIRGGGARLVADRAPAIGATQVAPTSLVDASVATQLGRTRTLAVVPFNADPNAAAIAANATRAVADALTRFRGLRVLSPGFVRAQLDPHVHDGALDEISLGRAIGADFVLEGSIRAAGGKARMRARLVDVEKGAQAWAERIEGELDDPLRLEDQVGAVVVDRLRARVEGARGPSDPRVKELYDRAKEAYARFGLPSIVEACALCDDALAIAPDDPFVASLFGAALTRRWVMTGAFDRELLARAEDVSLRALALDPSIGETYNAIGTLRLHQGEVRAAVRAFQDALARSPLLAEAHVCLGRLLCECQHFEEGARRIDVALRLDSRSIWAHAERARNWALLGDRRRAEGDLARCAELGGRFAAIVMEMRFAIWWEDRALAGECARLIEEAKSGAAVDAAVPMLRAYSKGEVHATAKEDFERLFHHARLAPRHRAMMHQIAAEYFAVTDARDESLLQLERAAELPLTDLLWLDRCPNFATMRGEPRFAKVRARVAARVAEVWK